MKIKNVFTLWLLLILLVESSNANSDKDCSGITALVLIGLADIIPGTSCLARYLPQKKPSSLPRPPRADL